MRKTYSCIAKTLFGLEHILAEELENINAEDIQVLNRAVSFTADKVVLYKANLCCRTALSILVEQASFRVRNEDDLYQQVKNINWEHVLSTEKTFMIRATVHSKDFPHSKFVAYRVKDAIADLFMEKKGKRPDVDTKNPDVKIQVHISANRCSVSLDSSGEPLFKRGYRTASVKAPVNECLAAGMLMLSGWDKKQPFVDPMCGSGTLLIEAAMLAHNIPPGMKRRFGFQNWLNYNPDLWDSVFKEEVEKITDSSTSILGCDSSAKALEITRSNVTNAFLEDSITVKKQDFFQSSYTGEEKPFLVFNPPYDERLRENDIHDFYKKIGDQLKFNYAGCEAWIISSHLSGLKRVGLRPEKKIKLFNGPLECRFNQYLMYKGSKKNQ